MKIRGPLCLRWNKGAQIAQRLRTVTVRVAVQLLMVLRKFFALVCQGESSCCTVCLVPFCLATALLSQKGLALMSHPLTLLDRHPSVNELTFGGAPPCLCNMCFGLAMLRIGFQWERSLLHVCCSRVASFLCVYCLFLTLRIESN